MPLFAESKNRPGALRIVAYVEFLVDSESFSALKALLRKSEISANFFCLRNRMEAPRGTRFLTRQRTENLSPWSLGSADEYNILSRDKDNEGASLLSAVKKVIRLIPLLNRGEENRWETAQKVLLAVVSDLGLSNEDFVFPLVDVSRSGTVYVRDFAQRMGIAMADRKRGPRKVTPYDFLRFSDHSWEPRYPERNSDNKHPALDIWVDAPKPVPEDMISPEMALNILKELKGEV